MEDITDSIGESTMEKTAYIALGKAIHAIELIAQAINASAHGAGIKPLKWKRLRSTEFAAERQRYQLSTESAGAGHGSIMAETATIDPARAIYGFDGFTYLATAIDTAYGLASDKTDRTGKIRDSLAKQRGLLSDMAAEEFGTPLAPMSAPASAPTAIKGKKGKATAKP